MQKEIVAVEGMTCESCVNKIKKSVACIEGVEVVDFDLNKGSIEVAFDETKTTLAELKTAVRASGYGIIEEKKKSSCSCCNSD